MKPQNKFQQQVVEAGKTLPKLTNRQIEWGYRNIIERSNNLYRVRSFMAGRRIFSFHSDGLPLPELPYQAKGRND